MAWTAGAIQNSLAREGVLWKTGVLAMPRIVGQSIQALQDIVDRLAALELMLMQRPLVSGRFTGDTAAERICRELILCMLSDSQCSMLHLQDTIQVLKQRCSPELDACSLFLFVLHFTCIWCSVMRQGTLFSAGPIAWPWLGATSDGCRCTVALPAQTPAADERRCHKLC